jgi:dTMP kinase
MQNKKGYYIAVEGLEGAGKSTAMKTIKKHLIQHNIDYIIAREPGATVVGEAIRQIIKDTSSNEVMDYRTELLLFYAARIELIEKIIKPALLEGKWVLSDRFELSSFAYQGGGRKLNEEMLQSLSAFCVGHCKPDLVLFLDISPEIGLDRAKRRGKLDRIEQESIDFFNRVHASYHKHLKNLANVEIIDATKPLTVVQRIIREKLDYAIIPTI